MKNNNLENIEPTDEIRFVLGKCNPIALVPGMLSSKLQVRIQCDKLYKDEFEIFQKVKFFCGENICTNKDTTPYEEHDLFISGFGSFQLLESDHINKYSACIGYFITFFNSKDICAKDDDEHDKYFCNYSKNIKIGYYGITDRDKDKGKCGLKAINNVLMFGGISNIESLDDFLNKGVTRSYRPLIQYLEKLGYRAGFSLAGIPSDYRKFINTNVFTTNTLRYHVQNMYKYTGKKVIIIAHSYGTATMYENFLKKENEDIFPYIKKYIAVGPPFTGCNELISQYFTNAARYKVSFEIGDVVLKGGFDEFGFGMIVNIAPTVFEMRPHPILGDILNDNGEYKNYAEAIRERLNLEKECGHKKCDDSTIESKSTLFNALYQDYFPLLTDQDCKFEDELKENSEYLDRKCLIETIDFGQCPLVVEEKLDANGKLPDFNDMDKYCHETKDNYYYQKTSQNGQKCADELLHTKLYYRFNEGNRKIHDLKRDWNKNNYDKLYGDVDSFEKFGGRDKYIRAAKMQGEHQRDISLRNKIDIPKVDTDIVYINFLKTSQTFMVEENNYNNIQKFKMGGDGLVQTPVLVGLKWIYDAKMKNLNTKIRLVELCSRLGRDSKYAFDPKKDQNFIALQCQCLNDKNLYENGDDCGHGPMIGDKYFIQYVKSVLYNESDDYTQRINTIKELKNGEDYEKKCNDDLLDIFNSDI